MKKIMMNKYIRLLAWTLIVSTFVLAVPIDVFANPPKSPFEARKPMTAALLQELTSKAAKAHQTTPAKAVSELSVSNMAQIFGRGQYRNQYLCGTMPWHRSFRDVNLCTGNLFKSFTDIQVAPGRGAGLALQRTYNSNDGSRGPFGRGWTHAYDIHMEESAKIETDPDMHGVPTDPETGSPLDTMDRTARQDFFGGEHVYKRDADGLYSPPAYSHDMLVSDYYSSLTNGSSGSGLVSADTQTSLDGTSKHFIAKGSERVCDSIKDKYGNETRLIYEDVTVNGVTKALLKRVVVLGSSMGLSASRGIDFTYWTFNSTSQPIFRIKDAVAKTFTGDATQLSNTGSEITGLAARYEYYLSSTEAGSGGEAYNLKEVHLDPTGLNRITAYTYKSCECEDGECEDGLLASVTDPAGNTISYDYSVYTSDIVSPPSNGLQVTGTIWVSAVTEPAGEEQGAQNQTVARTQTWHIASGLANAANGVGWYCGYVYDGGSYGNNHLSMYVTMDPGTLRTRVVDIGFDATPTTTYYYDYGTDGTNDVVRTEEPVTGVRIAGDYTGRHPTKIDNYVYGLNGNLLSHRIEAYDGSNANGGGCDEYRYYDVDKYFQKQMVIRWASPTLMNAHVNDDYATLKTLPATQCIVTAYYDYNSNGDMILARDAAYNPSDPHQFTYAYNTYGQKTSETNLNGITTEYQYGTNGDAFGNLTEVVQDAGDAGHMNRTTTMTYYASGQVHTRTDPKGQTSTMVYNSCGQPDTATFCRADSTVEETIHYDYGANGRLDTVTDNHGTTALEYELGCDRVKSVSDTKTGTILYTYTPYGSVASKALPDGSYWIYSYMTPNQPGASGYLTNRLGTAGDPNSWQEVLQTITAYSGPNDPGKVVCDDCARWDGTVVFNVSNGGHCESRRYVDIGNISLDLTDGLLMRVENVLVNTTGEHVLTSNDYDYDRLTGNRKSNDAVVEGQDEQSDTYFYDSLNRLNRVDYGSSPRQDYTYDPMGNRTSDRANQVTHYYTYNNANMLLTGPAGSYTNDANGNTLTGGGRSNTWDSQNRLVSCTKGSVTSSFTYGADGLRRSMSIAGGSNPGTTYYLLDGQSVAQDLRDPDSDGTLFDTNGLLEAGAVKATYLNGPRGVEYRQDANGVRSWYLYDGLGSVVAEMTDVDDQGDATVTATPRTDVWGNPLTQEAGSNHRFCGGLGHTTDSDTGLVYMRARYYDPAVGRFASEDPAGQGVNWYIYCADNPVSAYDVSGQETLWDDLAGLLKFLGLMYSKRAARDSKLFGFWKAKAIAYKFGASTAGSMYGDLAQSALYEQAASRCDTKAGGYALKSVCESVASMILGHMAHWVDILGEDSSMLGDGIIEQTKDMMDLANR